MCNASDRSFTNVNQHLSFQMKRTARTRILLGFFIGALGSPIDIFQRIDTHLLTQCVVKIHVYERDRQTRQRATLLLLTWIYFCRSGETVNFTLPFMTNVTISISTSQIFRSWVAIFQPRPPMASLIRSLYGMPGLAPRIDVLAWGRHDFQISFSNRDTSRNAWNRHQGSFMVVTGILSNNMKFPSHKC